MPKSYRAIRLEIAARAGYRCEYCLIPEKYMASTFHVEHIRPLKHAGTSHINNLAYACAHCNAHKGTDFATFVDEQSDEVVSLYNPRTQVWMDHFEIHQGMILGTTAIGRCTARILNFNRIERVILRKEISELGEL